jgi:hypothetical protein
LSPNSNHLLQFNKKTKKMALECWEKGVGLRNKLLLQLRVNKRSQANALLFTLELFRERKRTASTVIYALKSYKTKI